jgi:tRNA 2-selenouridine synthase
LGSGKATTIMINSNHLSPQSFLQQAQNLTVIDVRSPAEYAHAHIPGAVNIPLFDNDERALVGTCYKKKGKDAAVLLGLELVGPKLANFVRESKRLARTGEVLVHCWRGGMRSGSFAWLLRTAGLKVQTLEGGYKAYRNLVLESFKEPQNIIVLGGKTGSGKTEILQEIAKLNQQVIDLEGIAHHKGSAYGAIGQEKAPTSEQFENLVFEQWTKLDRNQPVWLEDESRKIGGCYIPVPLWEQMRATKVLFIDISKAVRIERLVKEYAFVNHQLLIEATDRIQKRLGGQHHQAAITALAQQDYATVADITLSYYDKSYLFGLSQRPPEQIVTIEILEDNPEQTAKKLLG